MCSRYNSNRGYGDRNQDGADSRVGIIEKSGMCFGNRAQKHEGRGENSQQNYHDCASVQGKAVPVRVGCCS